MEAILFLKINRRFWDIGELQEAYFRVKAKQRTERNEMNIVADNDFEQMMVLFNMNDELWGKYV